MKFKTGQVVVFTPEAIHNRCIEPISNYERNLISEGRFFVTHVTTLGTILLTDSMSSNKLKAHANELAVAPTSKVVESPSCIMGMCGDF